MYTFKINITNGQYKNIHIAVLYSVSAVILL